MAQNPYGSKDPGRLWVQVAERLSKVGVVVEARRCRERTALLLEYYRKDNQDMLRRYSACSLYFNTNHLHVAMKMFV